MFVNPTLPGVTPGYYNSTTGLTTTFAPTDSFYVNYGFYDGNPARGRQTGLEGPRFNGYYLRIGVTRTALTRADRAGYTFYPLPDPAGPGPPAARKLNSDQLMIAQYYQMKIAKSSFFQATLTEIPNPGMSAGIPAALAINFRFIVLS